MFVTLILLDRSLRRQYLLNFINLFFQSIIYTSKLPQDLFKDNIYQTAAPTWRRELQAGRTGYVYPEASCNRSLKKWESTSCSRVWNLGKVTQPSTNRGRGSHETCRLFPCTGICGSLLVLPPQVRKAVFRYCKMAVKRHTRATRKLYCGNPGEGNHSPT